MHIKGLVGKRCLERNPKLFPELKNIITVICEVVNHWVSGYKFSTKHINHHRFQFFLCIIFNEFNLSVTNGRSYIVAPSRATYCPSKKRTRE